MQSNAKIADLLRRIKALYTGRERQKMSAKRQGLDTVQYDSSRLQVIPPNGRIKTKEPSEGLCLSSIKKQNLKNQ